MVKEIFCVSLRNLGHNNNLPDSYKYGEISLNNRPSKLSRFALKFQSTKLTLQKKKNNNINQSFERNCMLNKILQ